MSKATEKVSLKLLREDDQESDRNARSPVKQPLWNPNWRSERFKAERCLWIFLLRIVSKALERQESKAIGW